MMNYRILIDNCCLDINVSYYLHKYGGIEKICNELNIKYVFANRNNPDDIKNDFYSVYKKYGHIDKEFYLKYGNYSGSSVRTAFGNFNNLMKELNIPINMYKNITKDDVIEDIKDVYNKYHTTSSNVYRKHGKYVESTIMNLFGTWGGAVKASGIDYKLNRYGRDYILKSVIDLYNKYGFLSKTLINNECEFTYEAVAWQFGGRDGIANAIGHPDAFECSRSSKEILIYNILKTMYNDVEREKTWEWLVNDHTGYNMYVDFYIPEINTVIEFDGEQHERFVEHIHKTEEYFLEAQYRDRLKNILLYENKIKLIRIYYNEKITKERLEELINI